MRARLIQHKPEKNGVLEEYQGKGWGFYKVKNGKEYLLELGNGKLKLKDRVIDFDKAHMCIERSINEKLGFKLTFNGITDVKIKLKA